MPLLAGAQEAGSGFVQRGVTVETTAENAVVARTKALAAAQRQAYEKMASEMGFSRSASDSQIESMVDSIIVEQERATRTGYNGRLTVNFNPRKVSNFAGIHSGGSGGGGGGGGGSSGSGTAEAAAPGGSYGSFSPPPGYSSPASAYVESVTVFNGMPEWLDLRRRLLSSPEVASVDILAIAVDGARLRLGLRVPPDEAARGLSARGVLLQQAGAMPAAPQPGVLAPPVPYGASPAPVPMAAPNAPWLLGLASGA
ncbi:hypothetical protein [Roseomonas marmotae]|uniref:Uncharacterized protein n=1 Tax=Roseomonas marmotae TaxID=2768161 RepID=A0ABS3KGJ5_9PROT|nr:hypothetical protein [Roseomonas marmotae]MBO1076575.1 hypothetical protein [Roseomonas marmotae]QTI79562.1 hypothetical protein IAI58_01690 [Roseomonas marmotae]